MKWWLIVSWVPRDDFSLTQTSWGGIEIIFYVCETFWFSRNELECNIYFAKNTLRRRKINDMWQWHINRKNMKIEQKLTKLSKIWDVIFIRHLKHKRRSFSQMCNNFSLQSHEKWIFYDRHDNLLRAYENILLLNYYQLSRKRNFFFSRWLIFSAFVMSPLGLCPRLKKCI